MQLIIEGRSFTLFSLEMGDSVTEFLGDLKQEDINEYDRINRRLEQLAERGSSRRKDEFNDLGAGLFETKTRGGSRVVFFYDRNHIVIGAVGFSKKSQKTPKRTLETARNRKKAYERQKVSGQGFNILVPNNRTAPRRTP